MPPHSIPSSALNKSDVGTSIAKCLSRLQIDDRLEPRGLLYRKIGRPGAFQDLIDIARTQTPLRIKIEAECCQRVAFGIFAEGSEQRGFLA
jgi:hypothetical protein